MDYSFNLENPLHHHLQNTSDEEKFTTLFHLESHHNIIPSNSMDSGTSSVRLQIISNIRHFAICFDPFLPYLAINYLDRFLSTQSIPEGKPWILRLIGISCVSLALKMRKTEYSAADILNDGGGIIFDSETIRRMELLILGALKWRMRSITPFAFVDFFVSLFKFKDSPSCRALKDRATEILFIAQNGLRCYEFKPSIVAASALLFASHELFPLQFPCFKKEISNCSYIEKDNLCRCYNVIQEITVDMYYECSLLDTLSSSSTPVNVLDMRCSSTSTGTETKTKTETDIATKTAVEATNGSGTGTGTGTATATIRLERDLKRRKITCFGSQKNSSSSSTLQLSQVQQC